MKSRETELLYIYLVIDLVLLNMAICFVAWIDLNISLRDFRHVSTYILHSNLAWVVTYLAFTKRNLFLRDKFINRVWRITKRHVIFLIMAGAIAIAFIPHEFSRKFFMEYSFMFYIEKLGFYWLLYRFLKFKRSKRINTAQAVIVGCNETGELLQQIIESNPSMGYAFGGYICSQNKCNQHYIGHPNDLEELIDKHQIHIIFYTISLFNGGNAEQRGKEVLKICNKKGVRLRFIPQNQRWFRNRLNMESIGDLVVLNPQEIPLDNAGFRIQKRLFDIFFSFMVIVFVLSWLFPIIALLIKLESKGPVFFVQKRTGINNKTFNCLKFRSMTVNREADQLQACANDARITKIGSFIRRNNIDEMPQFLNVFRGNMSVVGPRPHMLKHTDEYSDLIDHYLIRHYVKPGITGWAQVKGYRGETRHVSAMERRVEADMEYIENWTFMWDIKIIWLTFFGRSAFNNAG